MKYHPGMFEVLTQTRYPGRGQCLVGSLTGAVSSQRVTEEREGTLSMVGNHAMSAKVEVCLTARLTRRAGTKVGLSDPVVLYGRAIAQRIKGTPGFISTAVFGTSMSAHHILGLEQVPRVWLFAMYHFKWRTCLLYTSPSPRD